MFLIIISFEGVDGSVVSYTEPEILPAPEFRRQINNTNVVGTTGKSELHLRSRSALAVNC